jgi:hypothetical protein
MGLHYCKVAALDSNIRLAWVWMIVTNTLAYLVPRLCRYRTFSAIIATACSKLVCLSLISISTLA